VLKFFGGRPPTEAQSLPHAAKKTNAEEPTTGPQLAWLYRVKEIAGDMLVPKYSEQAVKQCIKKLESFRQSPEEIRNVPRVLSDCGIRFLIVETLPSAKIDGVCYWMNDRSPVVAMSTRFDRIDNFWFVLRHELEHVLRRDGLEHAVLDVELEGEKAGDGQNIPEQERAANLAASAFCVPPDMMQKFFSSKSPYFAERDVIAFAKMVKVHPGLVAGQLRYWTKRHNVFTDLLVKVRHIIIPTSVVDGWGDVAPVGE
jgi:HTH-type transcriptional regulator/antitoxin HigA